MRRRVCSFRQRTLACILSLGVVLMSMVDLSHPVARAAGPVPWAFKSFTIAPYSDSILYSSGPSLQQLAATGANSVTFAVTWYTDNVYSTNIYRTGNTASDASLIWAMQQARAEGLKVVLAPHLDSLDGQWRANINPSDYTTWFANYTAMIDHYADIAQQNGAVLLYVGAELIDMSTNPAYTNNWRALIAGVRQHFSGKLSYSANWGSGSFATEYPRITWWDALDYLGISAYFELANTTTPTLSQLNASWASWMTNNIAPFQQQWNKQLLFTEGGYRSGNQTAERPWDASSPMALDTQQQANCYESVFETWANVPWFAGEMFWDWSVNTNVDPNSTGYEVQNKPALNTVTAWYGGQSATATPGGTSTATVSPTATTTPTNTPVPTSTVRPTSTATPTSTPVTTPTRTATSTPTSTPAAGPLILADFEGSTNGFAGNGDVTALGPSTWAPTVAHGSYSLWVQYTIPVAWSEAQLSKAINTNLSAYSTLSVSIYAKQPVAATGVKVRFQAQGSDGGWYASPYQSVASGVRTVVSWNMSAVPRAPLRSVYVCWQYTSAATGSGNELWVDDIQAS